MGMRFDSPAGWLVALALSAGCTEVPNEPGDVLAPEAVSAVGADVSGRRSLVLTTTPLVHTAPTTLTVVGLDPFESVFIVRGSSLGTGPCPAVLGGLCLDIGTSPGLLGSAVADAGGVAELVVTFPAFLEGGPLVLQPVVARGVGGALSVKGDPVEGVVAAPSVDDDGDGFDSLVDCDDTDPEVNPGALEVCDGIDNDCDPATSEAGLVSANAWNYASLGDAVFGTPAGGVVDICGTVAQTSVVDIHSDVTLRGHGGATIDGTGLNDYILVNPASVLVLEDLTLTGADQAVFVEGSLEATDVVFEDFWGTAVLLAGDPSTFTDVTIRGTNVGLRASGADLTGLRVVIEDSAQIGLDLAHGSQVLLEDSRLSGSSPGAKVDSTPNVFPDSVLELVDSAVIDNPGGGVLVESGGLLEVVTSDFGVGATDNAGFDVQAGTTLFGAYGSVSTFSCTQITCL